MTLNRFTAIILVLFFTGIIGIATLAKADEPEKTMPNNPNTQMMPNNPNMANPGFGSTVVLPVPTNNWGWGGLFPNTLNNWGWNGLFPNTWNGLFPNTWNTWGWGGLFPNTWGWRGF